MSTSTLPTVTDQPPPAPPSPLVLPPTGRAGIGSAASAVAGRTLRRFWRTPQLIVVGALTSAMFLLIFRYVFGGAIRTGSVAYVDWLIPAMAAGTGLFASGAVGVAEDIDSGLFDRLRSLPIPRSTTLSGRSGSLCCARRSTRHRSVPRWTGRWRTVSGPRSAPRPAAGSAAGTSR